MSSLNMFLVPGAAIPPTTTTATTNIPSNTTRILTTRARRVQTYATASKGSSGSEEKGFLDWLMGAMDKEGLLETDPLLQKVEGKSGGTTTTGKKTTSGGSTTTGKKTTSGAAPPKKSEGGFGGLGGLFAKK